MLLAVGGRQKPLVPCHERPLREGDDGLEEGVEEGADEGRDDDITLMFYSFFAW